MGGLGLIIVPKCFYNFFDKSDKSIIVLYNNKNQKAGFRSYGRRYSRFFIKKDKNTTISYLYVKQTRPLVILLSKVKTRLSVAFTKILCILKISAICVICVWTFIHLIYICLYIFYICKYIHPYLYLKAVYYRSLGFY
jgi:hypothetical protein